MVTRRKIYSLKIRLFSYYSNIFFFSLICYRKTEVGGPVPREFEASSSVPHEGAIHEKTAKTSPGYGDFIRIA
jgi:hypothetical protein